MELIDVHPVEVVLMSESESVKMAFGESLELLMTSLADVDKQLAADKRSNPEDQLKVPVSTFLNQAARAFNRKITVMMEHRQVSGDVVEGVRLDMAVKGGRGQLLGHVELKAPGKSANPFRKAGWSKHDRAQWEKLSNHPNLIYTNGWEWTLLRTGAGAPMAHVVLNPDATGAALADQVAQIEDLFSQFVSWKPLAPSTPKVLADQLAPLTAFLRDTVLDILEGTPESKTGLPSLYNRWQEILIPGATVKDFADSFAQTFTYALLLARIESDRPANEFTASAVTNALLKNGHKLIGSVLEMMSQKSYREPVEGPVGLLETTIGAVDPDKIAAKSDPWLYFYEDFLATYDPKMRNDAGVYYTPVEVVRFQVRLLDEILRTRFGRQRGLGADDIQLLDPAVGTGAYPLAVAEHVLRDSSAPVDDARSLARRMFAFELLVGPYSVAHLRLTQMLEQTGAELGADGVQVFLTNTLTDAGDIAGANQQISIWEIEQNLNEETRRAGLVKKADTQIRVILGNPPYDRGSRQKTLGAGSERFPNVILEEVNRRAPLLDDFIKPLKAIGAGGQAKNLYNSYVYFIRWAIWKACEQHRDEAGVVSFITSSSYLRGPGFAGMRECMRRMFDELWIVDLGGEGRGARKEENVFAIQTPVAIFFGIQWEKTRTGSVKKHSDRIRSKAAVHYLRVEGTREEKLAALSAVTEPKDDSDWVRLESDDWHGKFVPDTAASMAAFAPLDWVFPWHVSGAQFKRKWPIACSAQVLSERWAELFSSGVADPGLFIEDRDVKISSKKYGVFSGAELPQLNEPRAVHSMAEPARYGYRSFDRQWALPDHRVGTYIRQQLWDAFSDRQVFFATLTSTSMSAGPALTVSPYVPDLHFFRGSFGAKNVHPLYRTDGSDAPNVSSVLLCALAETYGRSVGAEDVASYVFGLLGTGAYTAKFADELAESPARVPFTSDFALFQEVRDFGRRLVFEQTWGERFGELNEFGQPVGQRFQGQARVDQPTSTGEYPDEWAYDAEAHALRIGGSGIISGVAPEVMAYNVSGMNVVASWLGYRMKTPAGKSSSPLDQIQAESWEFDRELLELLWQVEFFLAAETDGARLLDRVVTGDLVAVERMGPPPANEVKAPPKASRGQTKMA